MKLVTERGMTLAEAWDEVEKHVPPLTAEQLIVLKGGEDGLAIAQTGPMPHAMVR